jgi:hypothetical protein
MSVKVRIEYSRDCECPSDWGGWKLYSFNTRHSTFKHPGDLGIAGIDEYGEPVVESIGLRRQLKYGTAFMLGYFEHGLCRWALSHEENPHNLYMGFDNVSVAGLLVWGDGSKHLPKTYKERQDSARHFLETYTDWSNGQVFWIELTVDDEDIASVGDFIGHKDVKAGIEQLLEENDLDLSEVGEYIGEAAGVMQ